MRISFTYVGRAGHVQPLVQIARLHCCRAYDRCTGQTAMTPLIDSAGTQACTANDSTFGDPAQRLLRPIALLAAQIWGRAGDRCSGNSF